MRFNTVAKAGVRISALSFGAGTAAGLMCNGEFVDQVAAVRAALDAGVNHFDTSPFYGFGASEIYLGQALRAAGAKDALITSKVPITREFLETRSLRRRVRSSVEQSLYRLRRETIDFLLVHNSVQRVHRFYDKADVGEAIARTRNDNVPILTFDDVLGEDGIFEEVERLIAEGKVRAFGLSGQDHDPMAVRALVASGRISIFNQPYNLLNPSAGYPAAREGRRITGDFARRQRQLFIEFEDIIDTAAAAGVGVSVISPLAAGALTDAAVGGEAPPAVAERGARFPMPGQYQRQLELARRFQAVAQAAGMALTEMAVRFLVATPSVSTITLGASSAAQIEQVAPAIDKPPLPDDVLARLRAIWFDGNAA